MRTILAFTIAATLTAAAARAADPYAAVDAMRTAFAQVRSATAVEHFSSGDVATVNYNAPNRYRITTEKSEIVVTGDTEYAKRKGGQWVLSPHGAMHQEILKSVWQLAGRPGTDLHKLYKIVPLGSKVVDGTAVRGYHLADTTGGYDETLWIGANDLPLEAQISMTGQTIDIHYADYNRSMLVATPIR